MGLNKSRGQMFPWVTHTFNPIRGCLYNCNYCYLSSFLSYEMTPRFQENELKRGLGKNKVIFVGSTSDMWGEWITVDQIEAVMAHCENYPDNTYLFQSKNPRRFKDFRFPFKTILGTTIETNRQRLIKSMAPRVAERVEAMATLVAKRKMISVEPIMDFDLEEMVRIVSLIKPEFISIGSDSKKHGLEEPPWKKVQDLTNALRGITEVREKPNLKRLRMEKDFS